MSNRFNLPDISFFDKAPEKIVSDMLFCILEQTGYELQRADPRRKMVEALATFVSLERNKAEHELKQNLLAYAEDDMLEHKGIEFDTSRLPATAATTSIKFDLELGRVSALVIPAGIRALVANVYFVTTDTVVVPLGVDSVTIPMQCEELGEIGNGYLPGEISTLVDPLPYVKGISNITETAGGADIEDDDSYAERIRLAPEKFSVAGPELAYKYYALTASQDIIDAEAISPSPGTTQIVALLKNGELPTSEHLEKITEICSAQDVRPLTDNVIATEPEVVEYDMVVEYWISQSNSTIANTLTPLIETEFKNYLVWQRSKLGRDINSSELIARLKDKGAQRIKVTGENYLDLTKVQIARERNVSITFKGLTDD